MATRVGILTGGGDCPGLNAAIRGVVGRLHACHGLETVGIRNGWQGLLTDDVVPLDRDAVRGIVSRGGTILGTSRFDPYVHGDGLASIAPVVDRHGIDAVVVIGGDGTLSSALRLWQEGLPVVGVPKTIDNDIARDRRHVRLRHRRAHRDRRDRPADHHRRGAPPRDAGRGDGSHEGLDRPARRDRLRRRRDPGPGGAVRPERGGRQDPLATRAGSQLLRRRRRGGRRVRPRARSSPPLSTSTASSASAVSSFTIARRLEELTGIETRVTVLGHLQRGGTPTARDRVLATRFGAGAADLVAAGTFGVMVAVRGEQIVPVPLADACGEIRASTSRSPTSRAPSAPPDQP